MCCLSVLHITYSVRTYVQCMYSAPSNNPVLLQLKNTSLRKQHTSTQYTYGSNVAYTAHTVTASNCTQQSQMAEYLIVDTDAKTSINVECVEKPLHADKHQVQVVHS